MMAEQPRHRLRWFQMAIGVAFASQPQFVDRAFLADRGDDVLQHAAIGVVVQHVAGGERGQAVRACGTIRLVPAQRLAGAALRCQADMAARAEYLRHPAQRHRIGAVLSRYQRGHQPLGGVGDIVPVQETSPFFAALRVGAVLAARQQPGQPRPAGAILRPDQDAGAVDQVEPASRDRADMLPVLLRHLFAGVERTDHPGDRIAIDDPQRGHLHQRGGGEQFLARRRAAQEREMRGDLQLAVCHGRF